MGVIAGTGLKTKNKAFQAAFQRGMAAAAAGQRPHDCPYKIAPHGCHRRNGGTWGAIFRHYWRAGFFHYRKGENTPWLDLSSGA